jgi:putative addiction module killer protein
VRKTDTFSNWLEALRDRRARARSRSPIDRLALGNPDDVAPVGEAVSELRIDYGPGYRVYYVQRGAAAIMLLAGGDQRTQSRDLQTTLGLARRV